MVAVTPNTLSWDQGHAVALRCKAILEEHGIHDVHCEIRESIVRLLTESTSTKPASTNETEPTFQLSSGFPEPISARDTYGASYATFTDYLGTRITTRDRPNLAGTKGLYLSLPPSAHGEPRLVALTCRHVAVHSRTGTGPSRDIIQVDQPTLLDELDRYEEIAELYAEKADEYSKRGEADVVAECTELKNSAEVLVKIMKSCKAASSRVIGQLLYSHESSCATTTGADWLRDWALVELQPAGHQAPLDSIKNRIFTGPEFRWSYLLKKGKPGWVIEW
ncbi:hypothetical protein HDV57DRAFT_461989 [Trichoderma longibrachiatum]|uniref:Uncharacterized protein n=1 Tax=Trichoderma longibrachiatum ATCC 18648 TaxID=983965 RepID=A0A2T4C5F7_TRILO|nr:hypothetical protein M440DRAFT_1234209 [Trichoderma longibrachiatum ATCC 18648]